MNLAKWSFSCFKNYVLVYIHQKLNRGKKIATVHFYFLNNRFDNNNPTPPTTMNNAERMSKSSADKSKKISLKMPIPSNAKPSIFTLRQPRFAPAIRAALATAKIVIVFPVTATA